ncbi:ATP-dependent DNA helicase RecG [Candidatus Peregrinibacteria bacterium]|nr:ATP-dependent DNA helicase RecG [Candidatus Peregrinibacteria bacterium]
MTINLNKKIDQALRTTKRHVALLDYLNIRTVEDFLLYFPRSYEDRSQFQKVRDIIADNVVTLKGTLSSLVKRKSRSGKFLIQCLLTDDTGSIEVTWFNQPYVAQVIRVGELYILTGKVKYRLGRLSLTAPDFELVSDQQIHTARIIPIYHETEGLTSKWIREKMKILLRFSSEFEEYMPDWILKKHNLMSFVKALKEIHFPSDFRLLRKARLRLAFDEFFMIQFLALKRKWHFLQGVSENFHKHIKVDLDVLKLFIDTLPFRLTRAQKKVLIEILNDLKKSVPMLRLLQGDVGCGKTVVAASVIFMTVQSRYQAVIMAPTEILARQHFENFRRLFEPFGISCDLLIGSKKESEKKIVKQRLFLGELDVIVGTHALIQEDVRFKNLGLAVIDEQHRFGVRQRDVLKTHGYPHLLNMSATPIPRTLAMTLYGDQDLSIIDEMPPGRQKIITRIVPEKKRSDAYSWIKEQVKQGRQVYVICPLIDPSDVLEVKSVNQEYEYLRTEIFSEFNVGLLHGKLLPQKKDEIMQDFVLNNTQILVSTSVVEVGIDVANATIMIIEGAERFGLSQLHQFRGRVGRGQHQSYCFLFTKSDRNESQKRLEAMVAYDNGFTLAELDLQLRGPGEVYGLKQSGIPDLKVASLTDTVLLIKARESAHELLEQDPTLQNYPRLRHKFEVLETY